MKALVLVGLFFLAECCLAKHSVAHPDDSSRVDLLNRMALSMRESDHDMALQYANDALQLADKIAYTRGKAAALGNIGWAYYRKSDYVKSIQHSIEAMKLSEQVKDTLEMARSMNNIAAVSYEQKQYDKSLAEFRQALMLSYHSTDKAVTCRTLNNIAYLFMMIAKPNIDSSEYYARRGTAIGEEIKDSYLIAFSMRTLGDVLLKKKDYPQALKHFERAVALAEATNNNSMKAATYHRIAKLHLEMRRPKPAIKLLEQNAEVAKSFGYLEELERTYKLLSQIYAQQNENDKAYGFLKKYTTLHDSIFNQQSTRQIALLHNQFDLDIKQAQIELLTKEADIKQREYDSQRNQLYATILAASCILMLVVVMLYSVQKVKRTNRELESQKAELALRNSEIGEKSQELSLLNHTKDKLFSIIGHDFRSPLHSLKGVLELIGSRNMSQHEFQLVSVDLKKKVDVVYSNLDNILNWSVSQLNGIQTKQVRVNVGQLVWEVVELNDEAARVKNVALSNEVNPTVEVRADKDQVRLVIRNLVSNALKFTPPGGEVKIEAEVIKNAVRVTVKDSGVGIVPEDLNKLFVKQSLYSAKGTNNEKGLGLGLLLCKEFIEKNNGILEVKSEPGTGTMVAFTLPLYAEMVTAGHDYTMGHLSSIR
jgi:signal transduction histidine kinase